MELLINPTRIEDYRLFLRAKALPSFRCQGHCLHVPDEYAGELGAIRQKAARGRTYQPIAGLFDYQTDISRLAIHKRKFAVFADCGLGKTMMLLEYARHVRSVLPKAKRVLVVSPLMVVKQTLAEAESWYQGKLPMERVASKDLNAWMRGTGGIGITNYDALNEDTPQGNLGALILDESSMLKSHYGKWGQTCLRLGAGLEWKLALTGTPAPNDRIEFANHAVFMDAFPTVNSFLARYFVNKGQTQERWILKPHALHPFYRDLSHWCIFLTNPATYGWKDNCENIPPINVHIHDLDLTNDQREAVFQLTGKLFMDEPGGITKRAKLSQIGKGNYNGQKIDTVKPAFIKALAESWPEESTIIWCWFNAEQDELAKLFPDAANIAGETPIDARERLLADFKEGRRKILISKPKVLGYGLNLQVATRQVFSSLIDSYESFYQAVKRSNRYGSTRPLNVHVPITEIERPMVDTVLRKASRVQKDSEEQEAIFKGSMTR
jgi:superfamily II DNA or RNA helicase